MIDRKTKFFGKVLPERVESDKVNVQWTFIANSEEGDAP